MRTRERSVLLSERLVTIARKQITSRKCAKRQRQIHEMDINQNFDSSDSYSEKFVLTVQQVNEVETQNHSDYEYKQTACRISVRQWINSKHLASPHL
jgi:hypothetical protein